MLQIQYYKKIPKIPNSLPILPLIWLISFGNCFLVQHKKKDQVEKQKKTNYKRNKRRTVDILRKKQDGWAYLWVVGLSMGGGIGLSLGGGFNNGM